MQKPAEEIDLLALIRAGWRRRKLLAGGAGLGVFLAVVFNNLVDYEFTVALQLTPVTLSTSVSLPLLPQQGAKPLLTIPFDGAQRRLSGAPSSEERKEICI